MNYDFRFRASRSFTASQLLFWLVTLFIAVIIGKFQVQIKE